ncbi:MAG: helix-turn-helix transcriptional regulator [Hyphomicrobiales bacterium]|nr:helix-turn-helix transcriptional regulator [Hyphomicrobiales bacterium]
MGITQGKMTSLLDQRIGERLFTLRKTAGVTLQELSQEVGITHQQLQKYEKGVNRIAASRLVEIAQALNVPVTYFFEELEELPDGPREERRRACLNVMRNFCRIRPREQQEAVAQLIEAMSQK